MLQHLTIALRSLRRMGTVTTTAALILALGIGSTVAMTTVYHAVLLRRLPVYDQDRVAILWPYRQPGVELPLRSQDLARFRDARTMAAVAGFAHYGAHPSPISDGDRPLTLARAPVSGNFFDVLGARPLLGRLLRPEDDTPGAAPVLVLSHSGWRKQFNADSAVIGRRLLNPIMGFSYTIVGVALPGLDFPLGAQAWTSLASDPQSIDLIARLRRDMTPAAAAAEVLGVARDIRPGVFTGAEGYTLTNAVLGDVRPVLVILTVAVFLLLTIVCVNVTNLLLLRATMRSREFAVRRALGASASHIVRQMFTESAVLGAIGAVLGLGCAYALLKLVVAFEPAGLPRLDVVADSRAPLVLALVITMATVLAFGLLPALSAVRGDVESQLRADSRSGTQNRGSRRVRRWLVASQVALALFMITGAGLLARSLEKLQSLRMGYTPDHLAIFEMTFPFTKYNAQSKYMALFDQVFTRVRQVPGVASLTPILVPAFIGPNVWTWKPEVEGQSKEDADATPTFAIEAGNAEYFETFGIRISRGRSFTGHDIAGAPHVAIVSDAVARRLWPGQDAIGKRMRFAGLDTNEWRTVVGVADDVRFRALREATPTVYLPWTQSYTQGLFAVRSPSTVEQLLPAMRAALREIDPALVLVRGRSMNELVAEPLATPRTNAFLLSALGVLALLLSAVGLYGVMSSIVREQTRDIGIRVALGATMRHIRTAVLRDALGVVGIGMLIGLAAALLGSRLLTRLLFEVSPSDPIALLGASVVLAAVGLTAAWLPARRASRVDPTVALRSE